MSQSRALSDDQVGTELRKMTAFIKQEALEKAREIEIKADEEFAIEKSKLVRQETASIDTSYEKKFKTAKMSQQITRSTVANKTRLRVLGARQVLLEEIFERARDGLKDGLEGGKAKGGKEAIYKGLVLEGLYMLGEKEVGVRAREQDYDVLKKAIDGAEKEYKEKTGKEVKASIDKENPLPEESVGGVSIVGGKGKIDINNTVEERLALLQDSALPFIRTALFGKNENRKFYD